MSLYNYEKKSVENPRNTDEIVIEIPQVEDRANFWNLSSAIYNDVNESTKNSVLASVVIPFILVSIGLAFIGMQIVPQVQETIKEENGYLNQGTVAPVSETYFKLPEYVSNPTGLSELTRNALDSHILKEDTVSKNYSGTFYISIPSLGMNRLPVQANVDSSTEESYMSVLDYSLAHFKETGLPISDVKNNIVLYGHSAAPSYNPRRDDPMVAFSFLHELKVGDLITIEMEGKQYNYKMYKSKIVEPTDISIITGTPGRQTLTLFTCWPGGNNSQRYVAIARPV